MNTLESFFQWLLAASLRASLLACAVVCLQLAVRRWLPARWRFALWLPVVLVLVAPVLPESRFSVQNRFVEKTAPAVIKMEPLPAMGMSALEAIPAAMPIVIESRWTPRQRMLAVWLFGTATVFIVGLLGYRRSMRCILRDAVQIDATLADTISRVAEELRLRRAPQIIVSKSVGSPAVAGLLHPMLLLPADFPADFSPAESRLVLMHELTHLKRRDLPMNWLMCVLQAMHWFNPLLWLAFARMRADRETACDAQVLACSGDDCRAEYGNALLKLQTAPRHTGLSLAFVGIFQRNAALRSRIQSIATHRPAHPAWSLVAITIVVVITMVGATQAESKKEERLSADAQSEQVLIEAKLMETPAGKLLQLSPKEGDKNPGVKSFIVQNESDLTGILEKTEHSKVLAAPRLITRDKQSGKIQIGREVMLPEKAGDKPAWHFVGITLEVTPKLNGESVELEVTNVISTLKDAATGKQIDGPVADGAKAVLVEQKLQSKVIMLLGETVVLGGGANGDGTQTIIAVSPKRIPSIKAPAVPAADKPGSAAKPRAAETKAISIIIPKLRFQDAKVGEVVDYIVRKTKELDPEKKGVSVITTQAVAGRGGISLELSDAPAFEALRYVAEVTNTELQIDDFSITIAVSPVEDTNTASHTALVRAFLLAKEGEKLAKDGKKDEALKKLRAAVAAIERIQKETPDSEPDVTSFRLGIIKEAIVGLEDPDRIEEPNSLPEISAPNVAITTKDDVKNAAKKGGVQAGAATIRDTKTFLADKVDVKKDPVIPALSFQDTTIRDAVAFVSAQAPGVKITVLPNVNGNSKITLMLKDIPLSEALRYISALTSEKLTTHGGSYFFGEIQLAKNIAGKPGFAISPYKPDGKVDIKGLKSGSLAECPYTGIPFLVP